LVSPRVVTVAKIALKAIGVIRAGANPVGGMKEW